MKKQVKRTLSLVLSLAMILGTMAVAMISANADDAVYSTVATWATSAFNDMAGNDLTTEAPDGSYKVLTSNASIGVCGYGIYGYVSPSEGNTTSVTANHVYRFEFQIYINPDKVLAQDRLFGLDYYAHTNEATWTTTFGMADYNAITEFSIDPTYGYAYKTVSAKVTAAADDSEGEFRVYTRGFTDYKCYGIKVFDESDNDKCIVDVSCGDASASNDFTGIRDQENYVENDNLFMPKGLYVAKSNAASNSFNNTLVVGGMKTAMVAGSYNVSTTVKVVDYDAGDLYTIKVKNSAGEDVATKTITSADVKAKSGSDLFASADANIAFDITEAGDYTIGYYVNDKATMSLQNVTLNKAVDPDKITNVVDLIDALPAPDDLKEEDVETYKTALNDTVAAVDALKAEYGETITGNISNFKDLNTKKTAIESLIQLITVRAEDAQAVIELIDSITGPDDANAIETAKGAVAVFVNRYGEDSKKFITNLGKLDPSADVVYGDLNKDGKADSGDALLVLQYTVQKATFDENQMVAADVNADTKVDSADALAILQKSVGKLAAFEAEAKA